MPSLPEEAKKYRAKSELVSLSHAGRSMQFKALTECAFRSFLSIISLQRTAAVYDFPGKDGLLVYAQCALEVDNQYDVSTSH